jgi:hypothetical protein
MVPFFKRSDFAERFGLDRIGRSKCAIARREGAIFAGAAFFIRLQPRSTAKMHFDCWRVDGPGGETDATPHGSGFRLISQGATGLPLMACWLP